MKAATMLTAERLREVLSYDPETGVFTWLKQLGRARIGDPAGTVNKCHGYRVITIDGMQCYAHRLALFYMEGCWPEADTDHLNGARDDNRWSNLREVAHIINAQNIRKAHRDSSTGLLGAHKKRGKFVSSIQAIGRNKRLGSFDTAEEAHAAYLAAKREQHEGNTL